MLRWGRPTAATTKPIGDTMVSGNFGAAVRVWPAAVDVTSASSWYGRRDERVSFGGADFGYGRRVHEVLERWWNRGDGISRPSIAVVSNVCDRPVARTVSVAVVPLGRMMREIIEACDAAHAGIADLMSVLSVVANSGADPGGIGGVPCEGRLGPLMAQGLTVWHHTLTAAGAGRTVRPGSWVAPGVPV